jgi:pimeloyl-ACP methyl ester carboxylesterase
MHKRDLFRFAAATLALAPAIVGSHASAATPARPAKKTGYATVNGLRSYYEIHGEGSPLVLLHGGLMTIDTMQPFLGLLAQSRQVIAVELEGHGRTVDLDRPLSMIQMSDDLDGLLGQLNVTDADVCGYSLGAAVALRLAMRHPARVRRLVLISAAVGQDAIYPSVQAQWPGMSGAALKGTPMEKAYLAVAPHPERFAGFIDKLKTAMMNTEPFDEAEVRAVKAPALLVVGDADLIRPEAALALFHLLGGALPHGGMGPLPQSQFAVLPSTTHFNIIDRTEFLLPMIGAFLDAEVLPPPQPTQPEF